MFPKPINHLIGHFQKLPGIGPKQAAKFAFRLLNMSQEELDAFAKDIAQVKNVVVKCQQCFLGFERNGENLCGFCQNPRRKKNHICVVETERDALTIESTGTFKGLYHVLTDSRKNLSLTQAATNPGVIMLLKRIKKTEGKIEIMLAMNANTEGQTTSLYLERLLGADNIKITRLGRGLSSGIEIEYADKDTLIDAFRNRK